MKKTKSVYSFWPGGDLPYKGLENQVKNYTTLRPIYSYRKRSSLIFIYLSFINLANFITFITRLNQVNPVYVLNSLLCLSLAPFIWQGKSWAMKAGMLLFTYMQVYTIVQSFNAPYFAVFNYLIIIFWWVCMIGILYTCLRVETLRKVAKK
jgi:hypothetical protein